MFETSNIDAAFKTDNGTLTDVPGFGYVNQDPLNWSLLSVYAPKL